MVKNLFILASAMLMLSANASTDKPTDAELNGWKIYLRSVSLPVTSGICGPLLAGQANYVETADRWVAIHSDQIRQGYEFAKAGSPKDRDFDQYNAVMLADFKQKFLAKPDEAKLRLCKDSLEALQKGIAQSGGA